MIEIFIRIVGAVSIGIGLILYCAHNDATIRKYVQDQLIAVISKTGQCAVQGRLTKFNLITMNIEVADLSLRAYDGSWQWQAKKMNVAVSLISWFFSRNFDLDITLTDVNAHSIVRDSSLAIREHIEPFLSGPPGVPLKLARLSLSTSNFSWGEPTTFHGTIAGSSLITMHGGQISAVTSIVDGTMGLKGDIYASNLQLKFFITKELQEPFFDAHVEGDLVVHKLAECAHTVAVDLWWKKDKGSFFLSTLDKNIVSLNGSLLLDKEGFHVKANSDASLKVLKTLFSLPLLAEGKASGNISIDYRDKIDVAIDLAARDVVLNGTTLGDIGCVSTRQNGLWTHTLTSKNNALGNPLVVVKHNDTLQGFCKASLGSFCVVPLSNYWRIDPRSRIQGDFDYSTGTSNFAYKIIMSHEKLVDTHCLEGSIDLIGMHGTVKGTLDDARYSLNFDAIPFAIRSGSYSTANNERLFECVRNEHDTLVADCSYALIRQIGLRFAGLDWKGEGSLKIVVSGGPSTSMLDIKLSDGMIRLPYTHSFITKSHLICIIDWDRFALIIQDSVVSLHKGEIVCKKGVVLFDHDGKCTFAHIPCLVEKLFLNYQKDFFVVASGGLIAQYQPDAKSLLKGTLSIEQGLVKKNIFSQQVMSSAFSEYGSGNVTPIALDVAIETQKPMRVSTSFLQTNCAMNVQLQGTINTPRLSGLVSLAGGLLTFPYKPLYITHAKLYFLPHQLDDPMIELVAKGSIKKYHITFRINGSLRHPIIRFESTPSLAEEQIITLLLAGSEQGSLALIMPSLIMNNIHHVIFGPEQSSSRLEYYFKNLLAPLKKVRITPTFVDLGGRGGFKGALDVTVGDRLHGLIQKTFGQPEDTKFEIEYLISDDVAVRGIKDERGDLGGEVEVRWKF
jgi:hypothetical protein